MSAVFLPMAPKPRIPRVFPAHSVNRAKRVAEIRTFFPFSFPHGIGMSFDLVGVVCCNSPYILVNIVENISFTIFRSNACVVQSFLCIFNGENSHGDPIEYNCGFEWKNREVYIIWIRSHLFLIIQKLFNFLLSFFPYIYPLHVPRSCLKLLKYLF